MAEFKIPNEWLKVNISDIADVDLGKTPKKSDYLSIGDYKVVKFRDVDYTGIDWTTDKDGFVGERSVVGLRELKLHDVLITASAHSSEHIGRKICFVNKLPRNYRKIFFCGELLGISPKTGYLSAKYCFYYFLSHAGYKEIQSHVKGVHLTSGQARNMSFPFTPQPEQDRIIEIVEELFSDLDNAIENLKKAQEQLKVYRQAVLKHAFEGRLVDDAGNWHEYEVGDIIENSLIGLVRSLKEQNDKGLGIPYVKMDCIDLDGKVDMAKAVFVQAEEDKIKKYALQKGDVLLNTRNSYELVGKTGIVKDDSVLRIFNNNILRMRFKENIDPYFVCYQLISPTIKSKMVRGKKATTNVCALYQKDLFPITIRIPSLKIQKLIVQEIDNRLSVCDNMNICIEEELLKAESLRQSILKQAFEGKLTEQWRKKHKDLISGENSAESLLKKIKAEKEALQDKPKGKK
ncbi:restriction endonuclease subunit S [bacterium]|jgi:type I restriction enzyme S subunit|nr:restriction endonuclease subunit S [bacterium]